MKELRTFHLDLVSTSVYPSVTLFAYLMLTLWKYVLNFLLAVICVEQ